MPTIILGAIYKDIITGFRGTAIGCTKYLTGRSQALIQPIAQFGEYREGEWLDVQRLERLGKIVTTLGNNDVANVDPCPDRAAPER